MCARNTVGGGNTPKEWTAIEPKEEEEETTLEDPKLASFFSPGVLVTLIPGESVMN